MIRRLLLFAAAVGMLVATTASPAQAVASTIDPMWMTNGTLYSQTQVGNTMYVGGKKVTVVRSTPNGTPGPRFSVGNLAAFDVTTGQGISTFHPMVTHATDVAKVHAVASDGSYLYIGGHFDAVDGTAVQNLARIDLSTGTVDSSWTPNVTPTGNVYAILVSGDGSRIYFGGTFGQVDGKSRKKLAAVNADGTLVDAWNPSANRPVRALTFSADAGAATVFIGGEFSTIDGQPRQSVARVDATTGDLDPWAVPSGTIAYPQIGWSLVATETRLYGGFGHGPNYAMAFRLDNGTSGTMLWRRDTVGNVEKVVLGPDGWLYAGGHFGTGRLQQRCNNNSSNPYLRGLMRLDVQTGVPDCTWVPQLAPYGNNFNGAWDLDFTSTHLWVAGGFTSVNGVPAQNIARFLK
jgi:hypothetical protein